MHRLRQDFLLPEEERNGGDEEGEAHPPQVARDSLPGGQLAANDEPIGESGGDLNGARIEAVTPRTSIATQNQVPAETCMPLPLRTATATAPDTGASPPSGRGVQSRRCVPGPTWQRPSAAT